MKPSLKPPVSRAVPWLLFGAVLLPTLATAVVGVLILALWSAPADIVLGILTLVFSVAVLSGGTVAAALLGRQNRLARLQSDFVAHVSHELRTPLASIRMVADTLRLGRVSSPEETREFLDVLDRETARLSSLVEQLLGFRKATVGGRGPREDAAPADLLQDALEPFLRDPVVGPRLSLAADAGLPAVTVDREAFRGALQNLVRNAATYGGDGAIAVRAGACEEGVAFEVRDDGPGIPPDEHARIFRRFQRGRATTEGGAPGLGLGLSLVKEFAESHGGRVTLDSAPGRGSLFCMRLPARTGGKTP